jgi:phosphatidate cytidylyltransferase
VDQPVSRAPRGLGARLATAAVLIAFLLAALLLLPNLWRAVLATALAGFGALEWARLCRLSGPPAWGYAGAMALAVVVAYNTDPWTPVFALGTAFWMLAAPLWMSRGVSSSHSSMLAAAGFIVLVPAALAMAVLPGLQVVLIIALASLADAAAYFAGSAWGRTKLAPSISPGKTREGALAGLAVALVYAIICGAFIEGITWVPFLLSALLIAVLSIVGDLFESALKRQAGAKDSGTLLPGHGGILDRIDSATATLPVAALLIPWILK